MAVGDVLQLTVVTEYEPQVGLNVRHFIVTAETGGGATMGEIVNALATAFSAVYTPLMSVNSTYRGAMIQKIRPLPIGNPVASGIPAVPGTVIGDALPGQVCGLITLRTEMAGRRFRGRVYVPWPAESDSDLNGQPTIAYVGRLNALGTAYVGSQVVVGALGTTTIQSVIFGRSTGTTTSITNIRSRQRFATQRRRGDFGQPNIPPV